MAMNRFALVGAAAVAIGLGAALYGMGGGQGNAVAAECATTATRAEALDPLVGGEIAAFQVSRRPENLSGLAFADADGAPRTLADYSGRIALVNIWATWCAPCRYEMPALDRLQAAEGGDDFAVVPISIDIGGLEKPRAFLDSIEVEALPLLADPTTRIFDELKKRSLAVGLPVTLLIDRNGCHLGHMNGPAEWDSDEAVRLIRAAVGGA